VRVHGSGISTGTEEIENDTYRAVARGRKRGGFVNFFFLFHFLKSAWG